MTEEGSSKERPTRVASATKIITAGAAVATLGIVMSLTPLRETAGFVALGGLATAIVGLHKFGRSGRAVRAKSSDPAN